MFDSIDEAISALKQGRIVIVYDEEQENEGDFVALAERTTPETINFMSKYGRGLICMPITETTARNLQFPMMVDDKAYNETAFTVSIDHYTTETGVSAHDRAKTVSEVIKPDTGPDDFTKPGHMFPLIAKENGILERKGHTEAAIDLANLCGAEPATVICEIMKEDGTMANVPDLRQIADHFNLKMITIGSLVRQRQQQLTP